MSLPLAMLLAKSNQLFKDIPPCILFNTPSITQNNTGGIEEAVAGSDTSPFTFAGNAVSFQ